MGVFGKFTGAYGRGWVLFRSGASSFPDFGILEKNHRAQLYSRISLVSFSILQFIPSFVFTSAQKGSLESQSLPLYFLAGFLPYSYGFPTSHFPETVCLVFILLVFLTFRFEKISDLVVFPTLTLLAFFSSFTMFYLGFSFFVIFSTIRGARKQAQRTSVFYKKRNVPFIFLWSYLGFLFISLFLISYFDFSERNPSLIYFPSGSGKPNKSFYR